jgi:hypothetical protein
MRRPTLLLVLVTLLASITTAVRADPAADVLYTATTIVTGRGEDTRAPGLATCLIEVLVKASGDPRLADDPAARAVAGDAARFVADIAYRDRMAGIPVHDEQGTRERPHDLTVRFDAAKVDTALAALGRRPWPVPRPTLAVRVAVSAGTASFALTADGPRGRDMREAMAATSERFALPVALPALADDGAEPGTGPVLAGTLAWSDTDLGWTATWVLRGAGETVRWSLHGVGFDAAFRSGVGGAAQLLSGNGRPGA